MKILNILKPALIGAVILLPFVSGAQSTGGIRYLPLGVLPMQFNSSFAGESEGARFNTAMAYKNTSNYGFGQTQMFGSHISYDQFIPALRSGIGLSISREGDWYSPGPSRNSVGSDHNPYLGLDGGAHQYRLSVAIAPKISIRGKYTLSPSVDFSYGRGKGEYERIYQNPTGELVNFKNNRYQSRVGLLFNTDKYYIGISTYVLDYNHSKNSLHPYGQSRISRSEEWLQTWVQAGYTFQRSSDSKFSFTPQIAYRISPAVFFGEFQNNSHILDAFNFNFRYDKYIGGFSNAGMHLGLQNKKLRLMVGIWPWHSLDNRAVRNVRLNIRRDENGPFSGANISLRYNLK